MQVLTVSRWMCTGSVRLTMWMITRSGWTADTSVRRSRQYSKVSSSVLCVLSQSCMAMCVCVVHCDWVMVVSLHAAYSLKHAKDLVYSISKVVKVNRIKHWLIYMYMYINLQTDNIIINENCTITVIVIVWCLYNVYLVPWWNTKWFILRFPWYRVGQETCGGGGGEGY